MDLDFLKQKDFSCDETWKRAFDLALAVWRVSSFVPPSGTSEDTSRFVPQNETTDSKPKDESHFANMSKEMLKRKLRKLASDIISELAPKSVFDGQPEEKSKLIFEAVRKIEALRAHLRLVQNLKLTKEINCQVLDKEYRLLKEKLLKEAIEIAVKKKMPFAEKPITVPALAGSPILAVNASGNDRLGKIVNYIKENKVVRLKEVLKFFPEYSEKTIRNDLKQLCGRNFIERLGNGAGSCYKLVA